MPLITFLFLAYFFPEATDLKVKESCPDLEVTYTIEKVDASGKSKIEIKAKGGKEPYRYFFLNKKGGVLSWKTENNYYESSANAMPAAFTVVDNNGCQKKIELKESVK